MDIQKTTPEFEAVSNQLFIVKEQQQELQLKEKELKANLLAQMFTDLHKSENGTIKKIKRKPKREYDRDLLEEQLEQRGFDENAIKEIINASTRRTNVSEHLVVKPKRLR